MPVFEVDVQRSVSRLRTGAELMTYSAEGVLVGISWTDKHGWHYHAWDSRKHAGKPVLKAAREEAMKHGLLR